MHMVATTSITAYYYMANDHLNTLQVDTILYVPLKLVLHVANTQLLDKFNNS